MNRKNGSLSVVEMVNWAMPTVAMTLTDFTFFRLLLTRQAMATHTLFVLFTITFIANSFAFNSVDYSNKKVLHDKYNVYWNINGDYIELGLEVQTTGWVIMPNVNYFAKNIENSFRVLIN